jgi:hypothetical protein
MNKENHTHKRVKKIDRRFEMNLKQMAEWLTVAEVVDKTVREHGYQVRDIQGTEHGLCLSLYSPKRGEGFKALQKNLEAADEKDKKLSERRAQCESGSLS